MTREQRLVFGEVAETYDRARPGYPAALVDDVTAFANLEHGARILEIGCGTGKATVPFAARGFDLLALEPSEEMAAVARRNCAGFGAVIDTTSFEAWPVESSAFALVISAQAWHWVTPELRLVKAHEALRPDGALALFWNTPDWPDSPLRRAIDDVYRRVAPQVSSRTPGRSPQNSLRDIGVDELRESPRFSQTEKVEYEQHAVYDTDGYLELLATQSDHRMLPAEARNELFDGVARAIDAAGGEMPVAYTIELYLARRVG
jgi:SAM-dependent methyltransferase